MAGGIGPQLGTGLGSQQQPNATGSANNVEQQVVSPNRGGIMLHKHHKLQHLDQKRLLKLSKLQSDREPES